MNDEFIMRNNIYRYKRKNPFEKFEACSKRFKYDALNSKDMENFITWKNVHQGMEIENESFIEPQKDDFNLRKKQIMDKLEKERLGYQSQMKFIEKGMDIKNCCSNSKV